MLLLSLLNEDTSVYLDAIISLRASALGPVDHGYVSGYKALVKCMFHNYLHLTTYNTASCRLNTSYTYMH